MTGERFTLDTNLLVYATDTAAGDRFLVSAGVLDRASSCNCQIGVQAVSEFYSAATRKGKLTPKHAAEQANDILMLFTMFAPTAGAVRAAMQLAVAGRASYWDALLLASAAEAGCTAMLTEDMADGATLLGVRIVNPFAGAALSAAAEDLLRGAA